MLYCEMCMRIVYQDKCEQCKSKKLRMPKENDPVYLVTKEALWCGGIEDILKQYDIPFLKQSTKGAGLSIKATGYNTENYEFFVPFGAYQKSKDLIEGYC